MTANVPELFIQYSRTHPALVRQRKDYIHFLSGGMAVKLFLEQKGISPNIRVKTTTDFDFVFAVPNRLSNSEVELKFESMDKLMSRHVYGFEEWLALKTQLPIQITKRSLTPSVRYNPITKKRVYKVIQFTIQIGNRKPEGLVDATLVYIPGVKRYQLLRNFTSKFGMPIQRLKHMYKGVVSVLAGSFSSFAKKNTALGSRNPLTGKRAEKGLKNTERLNALIKARARASSAVKKLIIGIKQGNTKKAYKEARRILKNL